MCGRSLREFTASAGAADAATRIGPLGLSIAVLLVGVLAGALWLAHHPPRIGRLARAGDLPVIGPVLQRFAHRLSAATAPLRGRLGIDGVTLVGLLMGLAAVLALAVVFTALLEDVLDGQGVAAVDGPVSRWLATHREQWLTTVLLAVTRLGNTDAQTAVLVLVSGVSAIAARSWAPVLVGAAGGAGIGLVIVLAKETISRQRPPQPFALVASSGYSFPSGHATGAAAVGMLCAWMLCRWVLRAWPLRVAVWAATIAAIGVIGFSRPYLGVHFLSDVLAGWALGAGWALSVILLASWRSRRGTES